MLELPQRQYDTVDAALQVGILLPQVPLYINGIPRTTSCTEILMREKSTFTKSHKEYESRKSKKYADCI